MKKNKAVALVLAASTSATIVMAKNAITAHADTLNKANTKVKNVKTYTNMGKVVNITSELRIREGASTSTQILGYLKDGDTFTIKGKLNGFYKIEFNGTEGYVYGEYVQELNGVNSNNVSNSEGKVVNVENNLRFRSGPSINSQVLGYFQEGQALNILGQVNGWYKISYDGHVGYADGNYIEVLSGEPPMIVINEKNNNSINENYLGGVVHVQTDLRIRTDATTSSPIMGRLYEGNKVNVIGQDGDWYKIKLNNGIGFVCADYIQILNAENNSGNTGINSNKIAKVTAENTNVITTKNANVKNNVVIENTSVRKVVQTLKEAGTVNVESSLRIRQQPSTSSAILGEFLNGDKVNIVGKVGDWYKIMLNGQAAYIYAEYVQLGGETTQSITKKPVQISQNLNEFGEVINVASNLRIRSNPSVDSQTIGALDDGQGFKVIGKSGDWYKINIDGQVGYVFGEYVKLVQSLENTQTNNAPTVQRENSMGTVINIESNLRVRTAPNTSSSVVGYLLNGQTVKVTGKQGNWYRISINGQAGYVYGSYIQLTNGNKITDIHEELNNNSNEITYNNKYGEVINIESSLRIRSNASLNSTVIGYLLDGQGVKVLGKVGNWYKIDNNGQVGYTSANYIKLVDHLVENNNTASNSQVQSGASFERLYSILKNQVGAPYLWGAEGQYITTQSLNALKSEFPEAAAQGRYNIPAQYINHGYRGFDCSGLLDWAFSQMGINIGRTTYQQVNAGRAVSLNNVRPGDLLFFKGDVHVGLYIGNGKWLVAPHSHAYVRICNVPWSLIGSARRVLN